MRSGLRELFLCLALTAFPAVAADAPGLHVDAAANKHPISPDIYGINFNWDGGDTVEAADIRATARRWGGNGTSTYHWQYDVNNIDADWFYEVLPGKPAPVLPDNSTFNVMVEQVRRTRGKMVGTIPILGWLPKARQEMCSYDVPKYGKQCKQDPFAQYHYPLVCGDGVVYDPVCGDPSDNKTSYTLNNPVYIQNDPNDAYARFDETFQAAWVQYIVSRYGGGNQGGVNIWSLDNEPIWWDSTHRDIHPNPYTYDELLSVNQKYALAVKQADPTALVSGPVGDNWASLWLSKADIAAGWSAGNWWANPVGPCQARRRTAVTVVSTADAAIRAAARHSAARLPGPPRLPCAECGRADRFDARVLGSHLRRQRRLLDR